MKKYHFFILLFLIGCSKKEKQISNNSNFDSIGYYINKANAQNTTPKKKINLLDHSYRLIKNEQNSRNNRNYLSKITFNYFQLNEIDKLNKASSFLINESKDANDSVNLAIGYRGKAIYYKKMYVLDSAFYNFVSAEKIYIKLNDKENLAKTLLNKGIIQFYINDYIGADLALYSSYNYYKKKNDIPNIIICLSQLGLVANELKDYNKAINYFNESIRVIEKTEGVNKDYMKSVCFNNLGLVYQNKKDYKKAQLNYLLGLSNKKLKENDPIQYSYLLDNLAYSKFKLNNNTDLPKLFNESLQIREKIKDTVLIALSKIHLSEYYEKYDSKVSEQYANEALELAKEAKNVTYLMLALKQASSVDLENASDYSNEYIRLSDSLQLAERKTKDRFNRIQLETDEIIQEKDSLQVEKNNYLYYLLGSIGFFIVVFVVRTQQSKRRLRILEKAQQKANEDIYKLIISQQAQLQEGRDLEKKRISKELHDGVLGRLFGLRLNLDGLNKYDDKESKELRLNYLSELKLIEQDIREISHELNREKSVLINNFAAILNNLLEEQSRINPAKIKSKVSDSVDWDLVLSTNKINLYRILQECLQNINKYAKAKNIIVELINEDNKNLIFTITDDGIGFDVEKSSNGIGIKNIVTRVKESNGKLNIKSEKEKGTKIHIVFPFEPQK